MTFSQFIIAVISIYTIYYLLMITFDLLKKPKGKDNEAPKLVPIAGEEVEFIDQTTIIKNEEKIEKKEEQKEESSPGVGSQQTTISGGVEMKNLLSVFRTDAVQLTSKVFNH